MRKTSCLLGVHDFKEGKKECQDCGLPKELFLKITRVPCL